MDKRNLLLISNSTMRGEAYLGSYKAMTTTFHRQYNIKRMLFMPYAGITLLMGYDVPPRRAFIEANATHTNIDA